MLKPPEGVGLVGMEEDEFAFFSLQTVGMRNGKLGSVALADPRLLPGEVGASCLEDLFPCSQHRSVPVPVHVLRAPATISAVLQQ